MDELERLVRELLAKAEELGFESLSVTWQAGDSQQERSYYHCDAEADQAFLDTLLEKKKKDG